MNAKRKPRPAASGGGQAKFSFPRPRWIGLTTGGVILFLIIFTRWNQPGPQPSPPSSLTTGNRPPASLSPATSEPERQLAVSGSLPVRVSSDWSQLDNAEADGWTVEVVSERAKETLVALGPWIAGERVADEPAVESYVDAEFETSGWRPPHLTTVFQADGCQVERGTIGEEGARKWRGRTGWWAAVADFQQPWQGHSARRIEFKIFRVHRDEQGFVTHQYVALYGRSTERSLEQHATWKIRWAEVPGSTVLRVRSIDVIDFEQTGSLGTPQWLVEATPSVLGGNQSYREQLLRGLNHWIDRNQDLRYFSPLGNPGLAIGDVNGDGRDDLYLCQEANLPNRLFVQQPDGTAKDVSAEWQVDFLEGSRSALLVDFDNDGDQDLAIAILGGIILASNEGQSFVVRDVLETHDDTTSLAAADYDLDGDVDLYVCVDYPNDFFASRKSVPVQGGAANRVYHDANNAGSNSLFRNDIRTSPDDSPQPETTWAFTDVTAEVGLDENNQRYSWAACWDDYDNDGDQDLYVSNDFGRNNLYNNQGGRFSDQAAKSHTEDIASGMSATWGDPNRDGWMDLYIGNMFSSAGGRITFQPEFKQDADPTIRQRLQRFARGNTLLLNQSDGTFEDVSEQAAVTVGRWAWSSNFFDVNNDGWQDIAVANGYLTAEDTGDL